MPKDFNPSLIQPDIPPLSGVPVGAVPVGATAVCAVTDVTRYEIENKENMINANDKRVILFIK
jgi:hypothetical protein